MQIKISFFAINIMEDFLKIGLIVKPRGIKGEVKVEPLTDDAGRFNSLKTAIIDGKEIRVERATVSDGVYVKFFGINDRNAAELLRGKFILISRENAVHLKENSFFIADLIGSTVFTENGKLGVLTDITSAKTDIFTVKTEDGGVLRFPFLKDLIVKIDVAKKEIVLKEKRLSEVGVYEI